MTLESLVTTNVLQTNTNVNTGNPNEPILTGIPLSNTLKPAYILNNNNAITTNILKYDALDGCFYGQINLKDINTPYTGIIKVFDSITGILVATTQSDLTGAFKITNLNPAIQYNIECIPNDATTYQSKYIEKVNPSIDDSLIPKIFVLSQSTYLHDQYTAIIRIEHIQGSPTIIINQTYLQCINIRDNIYKIYGTPPSGIFTYNINVGDIRSNSTAFGSLDVAVNIPIQMVDFQFNNNLNTPYSVVTPTVIGTPTYVSYGSGVGLHIEGSTNTITIPDHALFNVGASDDFELYIEFKLKSKRTSDNMYSCLFSSNEGATLTANLHVSLDFMKHGFRFKRHNGELDYSTNCIYVDYIFDSSKSYVLRIKRDQIMMYFYINNDLVTTSTIYQGIPLYFTNGGKLNLGFANWYDVSGSIFEIERFRFTKGTDDRYLVNNPAYTIEQSNTCATYFDALSSSIYDNSGITYDTSAFTAGAYGYTKIPNKIVQLIHTFGSLSNFTIEIKGNFTGNTKQYILYKSGVQLWFDGININLSFDGNIYNTTISGSNTVQFKKVNTSLSIYVNGVLTNTYTLSSNNYIVDFNNAYIMSDLTGLNHCTSEIEYILVCEYAIESNSLGKIIILQNENLDFCYNETVNYTLTTPYGAIGTCTWDLYSGSIPDGLTLLSTGRIVGSPTIANKIYTYQLRCTDSKGKVGIKQYVSNVGSIISLCHFEGSNGATTMTDSAGKAWTTSNAAALSTTQIKFGSSSGYFNGTTQAWTTPQSTDFDFTSNEFTISVWVFNEGGYTTTHRGIFGKRNSWGSGSTSFSLFRYNNTTNKYQFEGWSGGYGWGYSFGQVVTLSRWDFVTVCRRGAWIYLSVNGVVEKYYFGSALTVMNTSTRIGQLDSGTGNNFQGYIDELKVVQGSAQYITNFTPPTRPSDFPSNLLVGSAFNLVASSINNQIKLSWDHYEYPTTFNYYRSNATMNPASMPTATTTAIIGQFDIRTYTDSDPTLVVGTTYYIRIGSVKNGVEKISNEVTVVVADVASPYTLQAGYTP